MKVIALIVLNLMAVLMVLFALPALEPAKGALTVEDLKIRAGDELENIVVHEGPDGRIVLVSKDR